MIGSLRIALLLNVALAVIPAAVHPPSAKQTAERDPNERVCEDVTAIGSRIATKRVCATRAEWAEKQKHDRNVVDEAQRSAHFGCAVVPTPGHGSSLSSASCH